MAEFHETLPEDLRSHDALKDIKDITGLARAFIDTKSMVGGMVRVPGDGASEEDRAKFFSRIGRPDSADKYALEAKDVPLNEEAVKAFRSAAHHANLTTDQASAIFNWMVADQKERIGKLTESEKEAAEKTAVALRSEYGAEYDRRKGAAEIALTKFFTADDANTIRGLLDKNPGIFRAVSNIGMSISESDSGGSGGRSGGSVVTVDDARAKIRAAQSDPKSPYRDRNHPDHKAAVDEITRMYAISGAA